MSESQPGLFSVPGTPTAAEAARARSAFELRLEETELFLKRTYRIAELLIDAEGGPIYAVARAYWAVHGAALTCAVVTGIDLKPFQSGSVHHIAHNAVPHAQIPNLAGYLINLIHPPTRLAPGLRSDEAVKAFTLARALEKMRKSADYMGKATVTAAAAREWVAQAQELSSELWRYANDNCR